MTEIDLYTRIANLEQAVFGGPNVGGIFSVGINGSADALSYPNTYTVWNSGGVDAMTLAAPVAGQDDFKSLRVISMTAEAHTITAPSGAIVDGASSAGHILTFAAYVGANVRLIAYAGKWVIVEANNVTLS
jgi:hypothetical protein